MLSDTPAIDALCLRMDQAGTTKLAGLFDRVGGMNSLSPRLNPSPIFNARLALNGQLAKHQDMAARAGTDQAMTAVPGYGVVHPSTGELTHPGMGPLPGRSAVEVQQGADALTHQLAAMHHSAIHQGGADALQTIQRDPQLLELANKHDNLRQHVLGLANQEGMKNFDVERYLRGHPREEWQAPQLSFNQSEPQHAPLPENFGFGTQQNVAAPVQHGGVGQGPDAASTPPPFIHPANTAGSWAPGQEGGADRSPFRTVPDGRALEALRSRPGYGERSGLV